MTTPTITAERAQFLADVIVGALEGGIGYWATADNYRWHYPDLCRKADGHPVPCDQPAFAEADVFDSEGDLVCDVCNGAWTDARTSFEAYCHQPWSMVHVDAEGNEMKADHEVVPRTMHIGFDEIESALAKIADPSVEIKYMSRGWRASISGWSAMNEMEGDANDADAIVQVALFGEVVYG